jgi:hypothetical protein
MGKIETLKGQKVSPAVLLHQIAEEAEELRHVLVITQGDDGLSLSFNSMPIQELLVMRECLDIYIQELFRDLLDGEE